MTETPILDGAKTSLPLLLTAARVSGITVIHATKSIWSPGRSVRISVADNPDAAGNIRGVHLNAGQPSGSDQPELLYGTTSRSWRGFSADPAVKPASEPCPDCGAKVGEIHRDGCDIEPCPACGRQFLSCDCETDLPPLPWEGQMPGESDCERLGLWATMGPHGWTPCAKGTPGLTIHDLNTLLMTCVWDPKSRHWEPRTATAAAAS